MNKLLLLVFFVLWTSTELSAQKVKYKDIFPTLEAKNYAEGEPLLRLFFANDKNADEPSANLQMAYIFEQKAMKARVIEDSTQLYQMGDSAIIYFFNAKRLIDEKELKKNDDYYREFYRRDLRTGEFGIKLSDIHLSIDDRIAAVQKRITNARSINKNVALIERTYSESQALFRQLLAAYRDYNEFVMQATTEKLSAFDPLIDNDEVIERAAKDITASVIVIDNTGFNPQLKKRTIADLATDGRSPSDVYAGEFNFWDYKEWALKTKREVGTEIIPLKNKIKAKDDDITGLLTVTSSGGSVDSTTIAKAIQLDDLQGILKFDEKSFGLDMLDFKGKEVQFNYLSNAVYHPFLVDSLAITHQMKRVDSLYEIATAQEVLLDQLVASNNAGNAQKYTELLQTFGGESGLLDFLTNAMAVNRERVETLEAAKDYWTDKARWGLILGDSIDLELDIEGQPLDSIADKFVPVITQVDDELNIYTAGLTRQSGKAAGFVARLRDSRLGEWVQDFSLHSDAYTTGFLELSARFIPAAEGQLTFYFFDPKIDAGNNFTIVNVDPTGKINWQLTTQLINEPVLIRYNEMLGETVLFMVEEDQLATLDSDKVGYIVIDRNGKVR